MRNEMELLLSENFPFGNPESLTVYGQWRPTF
jgi:hypothetical protein